MSSHEPPAKTRRHKKLYTVLFVLLALACSSPFIAYGLFHWYMRDYVPFDELGLPIPQEFILTRDDMPDGWEQQLVERSRRYSAVTLPSANVESYVLFRNERMQGRTDHAVGVLRDPIAAARSFEEEVAFRAPRYDLLPTWPPLADWEYASPHADQYVLWIGIQDEPPLGRRLVVMYVAQYEYYVSRLWLRGDPELVTPEDVQQLVLAADARFADLEQRLGE